MIFDLIKDIFLARKGAGLSELQPSSLGSVLNVGGGTKAKRIPKHYDGWQHDLLDIDPRGFPDVVCDARNLITLQGNRYDAIYCSHNLEHYYRHDALKVVRGFVHMLKPGGFAEIRVPDIAAVITELQNRKLELDDVLYQSTAGPISAHDVIYGLQSEIVNSGQDFFAHKTGFTAESLNKVLKQGGFNHVYIKNDEALALHVFAFQSEPTFERRKYLGIDLAEGVPPLRNSQQSSIYESPPLAKTSNVDMDSLQVIVVCATRLSEEGFFSKTATGRSIHSMLAVSDVKVRLFPNNTKGLGEIYNLAIEEMLHEQAILVFMHDDIWFTDFFWADRIRQGLGKYEIVGLIGNKRRVSRQPNWAFLSANLDWDSTSNLSGSIGHGKSFPPPILNNFGPTDQNCKLLDGVLMAVKCETLSTKRLKFDSQFEFHFYDLDFCRQAEQLNIEMGTVSISVLHESGGDFRSAAWGNAYSKYLSKWIE